MAIVSIDVMSPVTAIVTTLLNAYIDGKFTKEETFVLKNIDIRDSEAFPGNRNVDISVTNGNQRCNVILCMVGDRKEEFLHKTVTMLKAGKTINIRAFVRDLRIDCDLKKQSYIAYDAPNGPHFYFGKITKQDAERLRCNGKKKCRRKDLL